MFTAMKPATIRTILFPALGFAVGTLFGAVAFGKWSASAVMPPPPAAPTAEVKPPEQVLSPTPDLPAARAVTLPVGQVPGDSQPLLPAPAAVDSRIDSVLAAWRNAEARLADLQARVVNVEQTLAGRISAAGESEPDRPAPPKTPDDRRQALVSAGVDAKLADDIIWGESRLELDRLTLRDQAVREGWVGTDRYREEMSRLNGEPRDLRGEMGEQAYDRFLYLTGEDNRVGVSAVIPGSAAEAAGLQAGDLIEAYAGERLFAYNELRDRTTEGEVGELVAVRVRRGRGLVEVWVPRGPLGIRMEMTRAAPAP